LNTGIFYAVLIDEVHDAISQIAALAGNSPMFLIGFSLGGNFVLRLLRKFSQTPLADLRYAVSISPVLNPQKSTETIDRIAFIRKYFLAKWRRSLLKKQALFPDLYDFSAVLRLKSIQAVTDFLLERYSDYKSAREYFDAYAFMGSAAGAITIPATVITAADDPIIPVNDFYDLLPNSYVDLIIHPHGGHNGFITGYTFQSWYEGFMMRQFDRIVMQTG
jgi:predicted alpha/beta-fold hydrolase